MISSRYGSHALALGARPGQTFALVVAGALRLLMLGVIAGVAGALFTQTNAYVTLTVFDFDNSAKVMVMLILGGTGRLYGAFVGAAVYMVLEDYFSKLSPTFWQFGIGLMLVLAVLFTPRGVLGVFENIGKYFSERKKS